MDRQLNTIIDLKEIFLSEMAYPDSWSWDVFKSLKSYNQRIKYCEEHLQRISSGTGRIAYRIDNDKVLKIARNEKGKAQNEAEARFFNDSYVVASGYQKLLAKLYNYDDEYLWLEMEFLTKVKSIEFKKYFGITSKELYDVVYAIETQKNDYSEIYNYFVKNYDEMEESNPKLHALITLLEDMAYATNYSIGDFSRLSSFGKTVDGRIVIVDYGLTPDILYKYY